MGISRISKKEGFKEPVHYFYRREGRLISKDVEFFLFKSREKDVTISHEHTGYAWMSFENAMKTLMFKNQKDLLKKAHRFLGSP